MKLTARFCADGFYYDDVPDGMSDDELKDWLLNRLDDELETTAVIFDVEWERE